MDLTQIRLAETREGFAQLRREIAQWADRRRRRDGRRQFHTALTSLEGTLTGALERIESAFAGAAVAPAEQVYADCRLFDRRVVLVRRLWSWFAEKFDQRDRPEWAKVLAAADEVAWSVHVEVIRGAAAHGLPPPATPAPLPYLDALQAPEAVPRDEPPAGLRPDNRDDLLTVLLARLPVPVVGLPVSTVWAPWSLALLGHEVGHHLEYDLMPGGGLRAEVGAAVALAGGSDADRWQTWSHELFADLVGLVTLGPATFDALLPYEVGPGATMLDRGRGRYPAPAVRIAVVRELAGRLGLPAGTSAPLSGDSAAHAGGPGGEFLARQREAVRRDLSRVPAVATALLGRLGTPAGLPELAGFDAAAFRPGGAVDVRADLLVKGQTGTGERGPRAVREYAGAALSARGRLADAGPEVARRLAATVVDTLVDCAEGGTRSAGAAEPDTVAGELADLLLGAPE